MFRISIASSVHIFVAWSWETRNMRIWYAKITCCYVYNIFSPKNLVFFYWHLYFAIEDRLWVHFLVLCRSKWDLHLSQRTYILQHRQQKILFRPPLMQTNFDDWRWDITAEFSTLYYRSHVAHHHLTIDPTKSNDCSVTNPREQIQREIDVKSRN